MKEKRAPGRPADTGKFPAAIQLRLSETMLDDVDRVCEEEGMERSAWIRRAIKQALPKGRGRPKKEEEE